MVTPLLQVGLVVVLAAWAFDAECAAQAEADRLRGTWVATAGVRNGEALTKAELARVRITFHGPQDGWSYEFTDLRPLIDDPAARSALFSLQPWTSPKGFAAASPSGGRWSRYPGIYELTGDTLRLCVDLRFSPDGPPQRVRPTAFAAPAGSGLTLLTLTRVK